MVLETSLEETDLNKNVFVFFFKEDDTIPFVSFHTGEQLRLRFKDTGSLEFVLKVPVSAKILHVCSCLVHVLCFICLKL